MSGKGDTPRLPSVSREEEARRWAQLECEAGGWHRFDVEGVCRACGARKSPGPCRDPG